MAYGAIIGQTPTVQASAEMTSYNNDNTSSVITADNVQGAIDQLFTSVSNGKSQIASAITDMGVSTSANDSFAQMATNIGNIKTGPDWSQVQSPAGAAQILAPYQTYDSSNKLIKGTITSKGAQTYTPKTVSQTIAKGQYLSGNQTIQGDGNLIASNIKSGVSIFGVSGSYTGGVIYGQGEVSSSSPDKTITFFLNGSYDYQTEIDNKEFAIVRSLRIGYNYNYRIVDYIPQYISLVNQMGSTVCYTYNYNGYVDNIQLNLTNTSNSTLQFSLPSSEDLYFGGEYKLIIY